MPAKRCHAVGLLLSSLALTGTVVAADDCPALEPAVHELLKTMADSAARGDYSGVVTLQRGNDIQVVELSHRVENGEATEVLSRLTGREVRILRSKHPTSCTHPGHELLIAARASSAGVCGLAASYRFHLDAGERIAGREALRLRVDPLDMYRYGYVFELDRETALMLKATTYSADQRVLEQFQFASLTMDDQPVEDAPAEVRVSHPHPDARAELRGGLPWQVAWVPEGFLATDAAPAASQRKSYTDGLAAFSVFLEPLNVAIKPGEGVERQGSTIAYTRGVTLRQRPVLITVVGEIPTNTARMVADSVRLQ
jgi:sigma-E factor negative regulatory protein RseB